MTATVLAWDTDAMPRRPPKPQEGPDEWAAWRIAYERERRGWSQGELARQITAAGVSMQQQNIWRIESGHPPRKIAFGEAVAFCQVFGIEDVGELGKPPAAVVGSEFLSLEEGIRVIEADVREVIETERRLTGHWLGLRDTTAEERATSSGDRNIWEELEAGGFAELIDFVMSAIDGLIAELRSESEKMIAAVRARNLAAVSLAQQPVVAAIVTSRRGVLITGRKDGRPPWGFVTGEIEPDELPEDAAVREVKEETGLEVRAGEIIGERDHPQTGRHMIYMAARPVRGTKVFVGDEAELAEVRWASVGETVELMPSMFGPVREYLEQGNGS
jgi:8-oxo-dGTP diphosphatase